MMRIFPCLLGAVLLAAPASAAVYWDDNPGVGYDPKSTPEAPCGKGTPPRGHFSDSVDADTPGGIQLIVRQDPNRLCYVSNGIAEAPVIRVRRGTELKVTIPGMERAKAEELVAKAHQVCPYSNATRGNIDVTITVV